MKFLLSLLLLAAGVSAQSIFVPGDGGSVSTTTQASNPAGSCATPNSQIYVWSTGHTWACAGNPGAMAWTDTTAATGSASAPYIDVTGAPYSAKCNGSDQTTKVQAAINAAPAGGVVYFPCSVTVSNLTKTTNELTFRGNNISYGTSIRCTGAGTCISNGSDDGNPYDANDYSGPQGLTLQDIAVAYVGATDTALLDGQGNYKAGTYGIRDWRGGSFRCVRCQINGFEYGFWGISSDIDSFRDATIYSNHVGAYLGPRSNQFTVDHVWTFSNDTAWWIDGGGDGVFENITTDNDGSATTYPFRITQGAWSTAAGFITLHEPHLEHFGGPAAVPAFLGIGVGETTRIKGITITDPLILTSPNGGASPYTSYLAEVTGLNDLEIDGPRGNYYSGALGALVHTTGTIPSPGYLYLTLSDPGVSSYQIAQLDHVSGSVQIFAKGFSNGNGFTQGSGGSQYLQVGESSGNMRISGNFESYAGGSNSPEKNFKLSMLNDDEFDVILPTSTTGNTSLLQLSRRIAYGGSSAPTTGTWAVGDTSFVSSPAASGNSMLLGFKNTTAGTPGTWTAFYGLTSAAATVATSGAYNDLSGKPTIPAQASDLSNGTTGSGNIVLANSPSFVSQITTPSIHVLGSGGSGLLGADCDSSGTSCTWRFGRGTTSSSLTFEVHKGDSTNTPTITLYGNSGIINANGGYKFNGTSGFTGTKTAGSCVMTIQGGIITNVTGC